MVHSSGREDIVEFSIGGGKHHAMQVLLSEPSVAQRPRAQQLSVYVRLGYAEVQG